MVENDLEIEWMPKVQEKKVRHEHPDIYLEEFNFLYNKIGSKEYQFGKILVFLEIK